MKADVLLHPIDVGFDLRLHNIVVIVPRDAKTACVPDDKQDHELIEAASSAKLAAMLRERGYDARVES